MSTKFSSEKKMAEKLRSRRQKRITNSTGMETIPDADDVPDNALWTADDILEDVRDAQRQKDIKQKK